ncbi:uncharacterized protein LOC117107620 [Anneissia japonica]|uniref:uncharacterized protein LOC117107620 n=1 Tax=Anneissia japonica TaxID=1529436 RepID=UPI00142568A6|nr:uncharacterized protein LOC117107620 [Anneissia japonica]
MDKEQGLSDDDFLQLLVHTSTWYDKQRLVPMLKVVYKDHIETYSLESASKTMDLLKKLMAAGKLSQGNLTLLYDTIHVTETHGLLQKLKMQLPSYRRETLNEHRENLIRLGKKLTLSDVYIIKELYEETRYKEYKESWSLIVDLEIVGIISDDGKIMKTFIDKLKRNNIESGLRALGLRRPIGL